MYEFQVRPATSILSRLLKGNEPRFEIVVFDPAPAVLGRLQNKWLGAVLSNPVFSQEKVLRGDFGNLPFPSEADKQKFAKITGQAILTAQANPELYSSNNLRPSRVEQGGIHPS